MKPQAALVTQQFNGNQISFVVDEKNIMVNLTDMMKPFPNKRMSDFLNNINTKEFINLLQSKTEISVLDVHHGGKNPGTWAHQKIALKFAAWLNPVFELWVFEKIEELLKNGYTKIDTISRKELAIMLLQAEEEKEQLQQILQLQSNELKQSAPKIQYYENVLQADGLICTTLIAKELGMSAEKLNKILHEKKIQFKTNGAWVLYSQHQNKGYTGTKTFPYTDKNGETKTAIKTYWTEKGRQFIHQIINQNY